VGRAGRETDRAQRRSQIGAVAVAVAVVVASVYPMTWPEGQDSFPLSPHPMFSSLRSDADVRLVVALGEGPGGTEALPTEATGHRHLTQAVRALSEAVADGGGRPGLLCADVAAWVHEHRPTVERVRIVTARFDGLALLRHGDRTAIVLAEHASCAPGP
jgi:hypothetical protein